MPFVLIGLQPARASRLKRRADDAKKQLVPDGCEHTLARLDDVHTPGALSSKLREAWQSCYYLPRYLRILVSPLESRTKRPRLYTEVQDSRATGLLPTKTLHTDCLSDSGACTAESTPLINLLCTSVATPQLLRNAFDVHMRSEDNKRTMQLNPTQHEQRPSTTASTSPRPRRIWLGATCKVVGSRH